nr:hypothetical protein [Tanacetum cinerariifolium]
PIHKNTAFKNSNVNQRVNTVRGKKFNTARPKAVVKGNPQMDLQDQRVIDSRCSRHMTRNISNLTDYKEIDGGYVAFEKNLKGGKIIRKAKTPPQNEVAERRNMTLIEAARIMLADSKLPTTFSAKVVNTACYVQNKVLVVKPHNKIPCKLFHGRTPTLSFVRPFGCPVTILNTIDHLDKFDGMADEGLFTRYSLNSKAFRVFNIKTKIVEENLHIKFSDSTPNVVGSGPNWLFDIDALTRTMNYETIVAGTQSNRFAGTKASDNADPKSSHNDGSKPSSDDGNKIEEEVYVCQPPGFKDPDFPDRVYKNELCFAFEKLMHEKFLMSSMREFTFFLGLQVKQKKDGIFISQDKYVAEILKKFGFTEVKTASTPMETQKPLLKDEDSKELNVHMYRSMIGSLMYLTSSRPDIMFAVGAYARYQVNPEVSHLHAMKRIFRYLKGQPKLSIWYLKDSPLDLVAYTDSDYAGASLYRKSTIGGYQLVSWKCKKQTVVANFTTEAEYGNPQMDLQDQGVIDSRCSRHMTRNMSNLTDYKEIDRGYVAFERNLKGGKIIRKAKTSPQNGVAERRNMTLIEAARIMLADFKLPTTFWAEVVNTACYVQNKVLVVKPHNKIPCKLFHGRTPSLSFVRPFGCPVTILNTIKHLDKFDGKADEGLFTGYSLNSKAFRVFNIKTRIVEENLHIKFSESTPNVVSTRLNWLFDIDALTRTMNYETIVAGTQSNRFAGTKASDNADPKSSHNDGSKPSSDDGNKVDEDPKKKENKCNDQEKENNVNNTNNVNTISSTVNTADVSTLDFSSDDEDDGAVADMNNLNTTIQVILILTTRIHKDHPLNQVIRDLQLAIQTRKMNKKDKRGIVIRNKARLVAQGYTQEERIDYDEVFAHVARIKVIRLFLAYASFKDFMVYQMDIKSAFLYGKIEEEVYVCQPPGFKDPDFPDRVYKKKDGIFISQDKYVAEILKKSGFTEVKTASTPMETQKPLLKDEDSKEVDVHMYRSMIGSLMYLTSSRPDIMFVVGACARYQVNPKVSHLHAVKRIFSDYAGASLDRKSTIRGYQLVSWQCKKQTVVANFTTEAEYVAASSCYGQVLWIQN